MVASCRGHGLAKSADALRSLRSPVFSLHPSLVFAFHRIVLRWLSRPTRGALVLDGLMRLRHIELAVTT